MPAQLRNARSIELSENERNICMPDNCKGSIAGFYRRGFVNTRTISVDGKEMVGIYITGPGITFLNQQEEDVINIKKEYNIVTWKSV
ncbi:MAG: hypothetical protein ABI416_04015 [Ginsengibacter sp.]